MSNPRPCECECFDYEHELHYRNGRSYIMDENRTYGACLICDNCMMFTPMDNLRYLEFLSGKSSK